METSEEKILFGVQLYGLFNGTTDWLTDDAKPTFYFVVNNCTWNLAQWTCWAVMDHMISYFLLQFSL